MSDTLTIEPSTDDRTLDVCLTCPLSGTDTCPSTGTEACPDC